MHSTGIVKRIDNLGRIVLPKEIRRKLNLRENDELEIFIEDSESVLLKKYSTMKELKKDCNIYAKILNKETAFKVLFTDKEKVIIAKGKNTAQLIGEEISDKLLCCINSQVAYEIKSNEKFEILKDIAIPNPKIIVPIIVDYRAVGAIILFNDINISLKDKEYNFLSFITQHITLKNEI